ncbi:uncharacterized protein LOC109816909 [Cajanus cajan]|uniref:Uncharacterized protein n=1 Tax=Cajanus cajan TaxID=3821 RepID=A0A151RPM6_CAJCA|nr:uncharacterized protein LOC109816909 [Cajanus cajan]KYP44491.1 hypothetical protein KK1_034012 [Cajanus cajan]
MKRQRGVSVNGVRPINPPPPPNVEDGKKKPKKEGEQKVEEEERKEARDMVGGFFQQGAREGGIMGWNWEENNQNMPWLGGVVDEQMSWGSTWSPGWDIDYLGGEAFTALYNDVVWDDDIWNLNNQIPIPLQTVRDTTNVQPH